LEVLQAENIPLMKKIHLWLKELKLYIPWPQYVLMRSFQTFVVKT